MYLLNELLFLIPLVLYAAWRVRTLLPRRALGNLSAAAVLLLAIAYVPPLYEVLSGPTQSVPGYAPSSPAVLP